MAEEKDKCEGPSITRYPPQDPTLHMKRVKVWFDGDATQWLYGRVLRADGHYPYRVVIQLDDGRVACNDECDFRTL